MKVFLKKEWKAETEFNILKMVIGIKVITLVVNFMEKEVTFGQTDQLMKVSLKMEWGMEKVFGSHLEKIRIFMKDNMKMIWSMDMEYIFGPMDLDMRVLSKKIKSMEKVLLLIKAG